MKIQGSCHCGNVCYEGVVNPDKVMICHCTDCQSLSGSAFRTVVFCREQDFTLTHNSPKIYVKVAESGRKREQVFCDQCGSQLYATSVDAADRLFGLRVGTINQRDQLIPSRQLWTRSAQSWLHDIADIEAIDEQ